MPAEPEVRAAGAVVWRTGRKGVEVLLIHRPRYDDWSLPKGKCERGESYEDCAVREVARVGRGSALSTWIPLCPEPFRPHAPEAGS